MNDPLLVRRFERVGDLLRHRQRLIEWNGALRDAVGQRRTLDELHHQRRRVGGVFQAVDRGDVRMVERGEDFRLALEARQPIRIGGQ